MRRIRLIAAMPLGLLGLALIFIGVTLEQAAELVAHEKRRDKDV